MKIELKGVTCMKEDIPAEAHVLYAIVLPKDGSDR